MTEIRIGGVPEHFNLPVHLAIEEGAFKENELNVSFITFDGGTGQMCKALRDGEVDACILLTEGIIKDIVLGNPSKIVSVYINTPLIWGIHTGVSSYLQNHHEIYDTKYAISRFGSGSHLMAIVDATEHGRSLDQDQFEVIGNLQGAIESLKTGSTQTFYWEKYTTKPYVDGGILRRIGEYITPWPCFVIAARNEFIQAHPRELSRMLRRIHDYADQFMSKDHYIKMVSERYQQQYKDVERWYHSTEWATHGWVSDKMIKSVLFNLKAAGILDEDIPTPELIWKRE